MCAGWLRVLRVLLLLLLLCSPCGKEKRPCCSTAP
jgi:hypothetical protein